MTDPLNIIFDDFCKWLQGYRIEFSCLYIPQEHYFISTLCLLRTDECVFIYFLAKVQQSWTTVMCDFGQVGRTVELVTYMEDTRLVITIFNYVWVAIRTNITRRALSFTVKHCRENIFWTESTEPNIKL